MGNVGAKRKKNVWNKKGSAVSISISCMSVAFQKPGANITPHATGPLTD